MARLLQDFSASLAPVFLGDVEPRSNHIPYAEIPQAQYVGYPDRDNVLRGAAAAGVTITNAEADAIVVDVLAGDMRTATLIAAAAGVTTAAQANTVLDYVCPRFVETAHFRTSYDQGHLYGFRQSKVWVAGVGAAAALRVVNDDSNNVAWTP